MKFPRPRTLTVNPFPDLQEDEPTMYRKFIQDIVYAPTNSTMDMYYNSTIKYLKDRDKQKAAAARLNQASLGSKLYFIEIVFPPSHRIVKALIDTGASNSLLHSSLAQELKIPMTPTKMRLATATGSSTDAITGVSHLTFRTNPNSAIQPEFCSQFIISNKLNNLQCILGAEFLLDSLKVNNISNQYLNVQYNGNSTLIPIINQDANESTNLTEIRANFEFNSVRQDDNVHIMSQEDVHCNLTHNIRHNLEAETLPPSDELFDDMTELKFELLEKQLSVEDADFSDCPLIHLEKL